MESHGGNGQIIVCDSCGYRQAVNSYRNGHEMDTFTRVEDIKKDLRKRNEAYDRDDSDAESIVSVSLNPIEELPMISSPFAKESAIQYTPKWQGPRNIAGDRDQIFKWEKPWGGDDTENETPAQRIGRLEQTIEEKKQDLDVLGKQYAKAQNENYKLVESIRSFKGEHYDDMKADNIKLKAENTRLFKENMTLRAQVNRMTNGKIREMEEKSKLEKKYGMKSRRWLKSTSQNTK